MKIKVCGLKQSQNVNDVASLNADYTGFIFVEASPRNVVYSSDLMKAMNILKSKKVGVFVNAPTYFIKAKSELFSLDAVQLHGDEADYQIEDLAQSYEVFKAFSVNDEFDFNIRKYSASSYFIFDTKGTKRGGNGVKFNWEILQNYQGTVPFFLSGGIGPEDVDEILKINHPQFAGVDVNSGFEISPGVKDPILLNNFISELREGVKAIIETK